MKRFKIVKKIIGNSENLNLKEFSKFASDPQKKKEKILSLKSTTYNNDLNKFINVYSKSSLSAYIIIFDDNNKISFVYYLRDFTYTGWKTFVHNDYWKKYQQKNNWNCFFKIIDTRKFRNYSWADEKIIFKYICKYLKKKGFQIKNFENCKKTFFDYDSIWYISKHPMLLKFFSKNNDTLDINKFINDPNIKSIISEYFEILIEYQHILWQLVYA